MTYHNPDCYLCTGGRGSWLCPRHQRESFERSERTVAEAAARRRARDEDDAKEVIPGETPEQAAQRKGRERMLRMWRDAAEVAAGMCEGDETTEGAAEVYSERPGVAKERT